HRTSRSKALRVETGATQRVSSIAMGKPTMVAAKVGAQQKMKAVWARATRPAWRSTAKGPCSDASPTARKRLGQGKKRLGSHTMAATSATSGLKGVWGLKETQGASSQSAA